MSSPVLTDRKALSGVSSPGLSASMANSDDNSSNSSYRYGQTAPMVCGSALDFTACDMYPCLSDNVCIGIGGGVGPAAGVMLHRKIIESTLSDGTDQSHLEIHHISRPGVADRTAFLLGKSDESPAIGMARTMAALAESAHAAGKMLAIAGVPCNTFHAPKIWNEFVQILDEQGISNTVKMVHMLDETSTAISRIVPGAKRIGLLSTTGTRNSRVYHDLLEPKGYDVVEVPLPMQHIVHDAIYNKTWGVKAVQPTTSEAHAAFESFCVDLINQGAEAIILGCTEIPLALPYPAFNGVPLVDPMAVLARAFISKAGAVAVEMQIPSAVMPPPQQAVSVTSSPSLAVSPSFVLAATGRGAPKWQQHAAAFVIQSHWRAHVAVRLSKGMETHGDYFRAALGSSPDVVGSLDGITPELFTPNVVSG
eukprot:gene842-1296_t